MRQIHRLAALAALAALTACDVPLQDVYTLRSRSSAPRGVAYDPVAQVLYATALRGGEITMITAVGREYVFHKGDAGLSFAGAEVDAARRLLWACVVDATREPALPRSWLRAFDLDDGAVVHDVALAGLHAGFAPIRCEDVAVASDGSVYATDGLRPAIYRFVPGEGASIVIEDERLAPAGALGLRGAALDPSGEYLMVARADPAAVFAVPLVNPRALFEVEVGGDGLAAPADPRFPAADGLTFFEGALHVVFSGGVRRIDFEGAGYVRGSSTTATAVPRGLSMATVADGALYVIDGDAFQVEVLGVRPEPPFSIVRVEAGSFK